MKTTLINSIPALGATHLLEIDGEHYTVFHFAAAPRLFVFNAYGQEVKDKDIYDAVASEIPSVRQVIDEATEMIEKMNENEM